MDYNAALRSGVDKVIPSLSSFVIILRCKDPLPRYLDYIRHSSRLIASGSEFWVVWLDYCMVEW